MLLSLSTGCLYPFPLRRIFALAREAGYDGVELVPGPEVWLRSPTYIAGLAREYGLHIYSIHQALINASPSGRGPWRMLDAVELALKLDVERVVIHDPMVCRWGDPRAATWFRVLELCQRRVQGSAVRLALENCGMYTREDLANVLAQPTILADFARRHDLALTFDTCHIGTAHGKLLGAYRTFAPRLANIHFSDYKPFRPFPNYHLAYTLFSHHQVPGEGVLPLAELVAVLAREVYAGPITMEVSIAALCAWSPQALRERLARMVRFVREASAR